MWEFDWVTLQLKWDESRLATGKGVRHFGQELGSDFFEHVHPDDQFIGSKAMIEAAERGEADSSFQYRLQFPNGLLRHIRAYARTYLDGAGKPLRSLGVSWDITNEVEAAERLERQAAEIRDVQRRLERASLTINEGHWEIDLEARKHWASANYYELLGYRPGEVEFDTFEKLNAITHPDDLARVQEAMQKHIADASHPHDVELRALTKSGVYRWFRMRAMPNATRKGVSFGSQARCRTFSAGNSRRTR